VFSDRRNAGRGPSGLTGMQRHLQDRGRPIRAGVVLFPRCRCIPIEAILARHRADDNRPIGLSLLRSRRRDGRGTCTTVTASGKRADIAPRA
jgi:hypothetical protein